MTTPAPPPRGGKILGMPRQAVIIGGIALAAGVFWYVYKSRKAASQGGQAGATGAVDYSGDISTLQSEFGQLQDEIAALQGSGGGTGGSAGGGPPGPPGPPGPGGDVHGPPTIPPGVNPGGHNVPVDGMTAHQRHLAHLAHVRHEQHLKRRKKAA